MLNVNLPKNLEKEYYDINKKFSSIQNDWTKYNDEIIPEDNDLTKKIIRFLANLIDYILDNYDNLDVQKYQEFLAYYDSEFFYGPSGDDNNYLAFDESLDGENVNEFCWELKNEEKPVSKLRLEHIREKYLKVLSKI